MVKVIRVNTVNIIDVIKASVNSECVVDVLVKGSFTSDVQIEGGNMAGVISGLDNSNIEWSNI